MKYVLLIILILSMLLAVTVFAACEESSVSSSPSGTYTCTILGIQQTAKFSGSTLELYNVMDGKRIYEYTIIDNGNTIKLTKVGTGETHTWSFSYVKDHDLVIIRGDEYYRD